jgi:hypothetical protein
MGRKVWSRVRGIGSDGVAVGALRVPLCGGSYFGTMPEATLLFSGNAAVHEDLH